ncbi:SpoIIE family protein phosphatase [Candidatus Kapabacteria bacterium]|nr:SpoIIE family protein phosphatase [Candidatus Kapabacteria bacterium]
MKKSILTNILSKGSKPEMSVHDEKALLISNFIFLMASLVAGLRSLSYFANDDISYSLISLSSSLVFISLYFFNANGYHNFAKFGLVIVGTAATAYKDLESGGQSQQIFLMMASFGVNFLLFSVKEPKKLILANLITFIAIVIVLFVPNLIREDIIISSEESKGKIIGVFSNIIITVFIIWYFVKKSSDIEIKLIHTNDELADINKEILLKNDAIEDRNIELKELYDDLLTQKEIIELKNEEIFASIRYAERIQNAFLPQDFNKITYLQDSFILFKPKDIVSGDFYWWAETTDNIFICVADCTGHGVPGAMLSMLGMVALNDAVKVLGVKDLDLILDYIDNYFIEHIKKDNKHLRDGVELSMIKIDKTNNRLFTSGAKLPLFIVSNNEIQEIKPSKRYIGEQNPGKKVFQNNEISYNQQMSIYLFSDGFSDQGNSDRKKIGRKNLRELISNISNDPMNLQHTKLENFLESHKDNESQRDDITILGFKIQPNR